MIQDIAPCVFSNEYSASLPCDDDPVFAIHADRVLVRIAHASSEQAPDSASEGPVNRIALPSAADVWFGGKNATLMPIRLFSIDDQSYYLAFPVERESEPLELSGFEWIRARTLMAAEPIHVRLAISTALQLSEWYDTNRMCGRCGTPMARSAKHRVLECPTCENSVYPRINPAVIVAVRYEDSLLMIKYAGPDAYRHRALIAGFCEIGETAEQTVAREVMEEAGVHVKNIRYITSQPWGFASDLLLGFACDLDGSPEIHRDDEELSYAEWVPRESIFEEDDQVSLTRHLIAAFKRGDL